MDPRSPETDALLHIAAALIVSVEQAMDRLLSLLPIASRAPAVPTMPAISPTPDRAEDIAIQQALDEVLEYHRTHRPKNTAKNYEPKQREWKVGVDSLILGYIRPLTFWLIRPGVRRLALRQVANTSQETM